MLITLILMFGSYYIARNGGIMNSVYIMFLPYSLLGLFLIVGNLSGVLPYTSAPAGDLRIALGLAGIVMGAVILFNVWNHGYRFIVNFMPEGDKYMLIPILALEIVAYLNRCLSLGLRIFINLAAGKFMTHIILNIVGASLLSLSGIGLFLSFEMMVAYLQCYIFCYISNLKE